MERFPYDTAKKEDVACNYCGSDNLKTLSLEGQDGLKLRTVICSVCGLIFISPRMTPYWYDRYYQVEYRANTLGSETKKPDFKKLFESMERHGEELGAYLKRYLNINGPVVEVGSSLGGVLSGIKKHLNREVIGIEPSLPEVAYAKSRGVETYGTLFEEIDDKFPNLPLFSAVVCTQSLNHLLSPRLFFEWSHKHLATGGILVLEVMNFRHQLKKAGKYKNAVKIDHVYMFTPEVLRDFVRSAGFDILFFDVDEKKSSVEMKENERTLPRVHMICVAVKSTRKPFEKVFVNKMNYWKAKIFLNKVYIYISYILNVRLRKILS